MVANARSTLDPCELEFSDLCTLAISDLEFGSVLLLLLLPSFLLLGESKGRGPGGYFMNQQGRY